MTPIFGPFKVHVRPFSLVDIIEMHTFYVGRHENMYVKITYIIIISSKGILTLK